MTNPLNGNTKNVLQTALLVLQLSAFVWYTATAKADLDHLRREFEKFVIEMRDLAADARDDLDDHISQGGHQGADEKQRNLTSNVSDHEQRIRTLERR